MKTITGFLLSKAAERPEILLPVQELADKIQWLANNSRCILSANSCTGSNISGRSAALDNKNPVLVFIMI